MRSVRERRPVTAARAKEIALWSRPALLEELRSVGEVRRPGDEDLLSLGQFDGIPILTAAQAVAMIDSG
jgi:hypothetical protein